ncbi:guanine/hypoxanthine permease PbuG [Andreesenia angusta]|uniref:Guanine/hypoxanthine permease PbuG n=1 Tax=Andreesenia angusta TaxID=39480 RepID=A0A1S1V625_9FIRM|nr:NCS2 family permease [Andreesenia angusta]OHW61557.1 guanine/hypoxanthine permease PbuG [Andreesenia angusta]
MSQASVGFFEKAFKLKENQTTSKVEITAGITTFVTMAYILVVNPLILADAGMDKGAVFTATAVSSIVATLIMAFYANYPFVLSAGMGLNAFFAYSVVLGMGHSWEFALTAVFIEGVIFILLTFVNVREAIVNAIPLTLKHAVSAGIGLFIAFIGFKGSGLIVSSEATFVALGEVTSPTVIVSIVGLLVAIFFMAKNVQGALLIAVLVGTIVGIPLGVTQMPSSIFSLPPSLAPTAFAFTRVGLSEILTFDMFMVTLTFLFVDLFDTIGMLVGTAAKANMLDDEGKLPRVRPALFADAVGTTLGACLGTSTITTFAESASGISVGGRTGLTAFTSAILFAIALFFAPLFTAIPEAATAPALIMVGSFMLGSVLSIDFDDITEAFPAFLTIIMMPLTYSIGDGLMFGIISYSAAKLLSGRVKEASPVMYVLAVIFILRLVLT